MDFIIKQAGDKMENFKQVNSLEEANAIDMDGDWTYSEGATRAFGKVTFKRRQRKK
ncbi:MAG: hypothetical protein ACXABK_06635 [Candidatus Heimdallarchaeaceae archaeon]|jgi:hypothetical protein